jgi:hypothetical protein
VLQHELMPAELAVKVLSQTKGLAGQISGMQEATSAD